MTVMHIRYIGRCERWSTPRHLLVTAVFRWLWPARPGTAFDRLIRVWCAPDQPYGSYVPGGLPPSPIGEETLNGRPRRGLSGRQPARGQAQLAVLDRKSV